MFLQVHFHSDVLGLASDFWALVPQETKTAVGITSGETRKQYPCLYLLHGGSDDHSIWMRRTSIERYAAEKNIAVIMPNVHRSYYSNMRHGRAYFDFVSEELPRIVNGLLPVSTRREDTFVAGLSMGGCGAFKLAMRCPERFAAAASLSGVLDPLTLSETEPDRWERLGWTQIYGSLEDLRDSDDDVIALLHRFSDIPPENCPALYQWCGTEDHLYPNNQSFRQKAADLGVDVLYEEGPGDHSWPHWDRMIQRVLDWMPINA